MSELFPELDAYDDGTPLLDDVRLEHAPPQPSAPAPSGDRVYVEVLARLARPGLRAGDAALARFEAALGLEGMLRSVTRTEGDEIELIVELPNGHLVAGALIPPDRPALRRGRTFAISYRGDELPTLLARGLLRFLARYDGVPFEQILAQVVPDPGDEHMLADDNPESLFYAYAPSSGWRRFFEGTELYRGVCGAHSGDVAILEHTDIECLYNVAPQDNRLPSFFAAPSITQSLRSELRRPQLADDLDARRLFTDIRDRDVIRGADRLLDEALLTLADAPDKPKTVFVQSGCLPQVTGDDLEASVARTRDKLRLPVLVVGKHNDPLAAALAGLMGERVIETTRALEPGSAVLLGMPALAGRDEIDELLAAAGVRVLGEALPNFGPEQLDACLRASVLVTYPWDRHLETIMRLCQRLAPATVVAQGGPYGLAGSCRWLRAVAAATGRRAAMDELLTELLDDIEPRWRELRAKARRYRLGFVIDRPDWRAALSAQRCVGVPMLAMLREMGFGVDILVYGRARANPATASHDESAPRVRCYRNRDELAELLAAPGVVAWYSELRHDCRLTRNGKNPFSLRQFRMGPRGALASLAELVELAELPFYRRYASYLGPAFADSGAPR